MEREEVTKKTGQNLTNKYFYVILVIGGLIVLCFLYFMLINPNYGNKYALQIVEEVSDNSSYDYLIHDYPLDVALSRFDNETKCKNLGSVFIVAPDASVFVWKEGDFNCIDNVVIFKKPYAEAFVPHE